MKKDLPGLVNYLSLRSHFLVIWALLLFLATGCSSGPSKTASSQTSRMESSTPEDPGKSSKSRSPSDPVISEPVLSSSPQPAQTSQPSTSPKIAEPAVKSPVTTSSRKKRSSNKRKASQPVKKDNSLDALLGTSPTMTAQESSSGSSIRGLSPVSENYGKDHKISQDILDSVRRMEDFEISDDEIERFRKAGKLTTPGP